MQIRSYPEKDDGRRVWLSRDEQTRLEDYYSERPRRELAVRLGLCGLRASEVVEVARDDLRSLDGGEVAKLRVQNSKRGDRETPVPTRLASDLRTVANARGLSSSDPVVDRDSDTVTRWVRNAAEDLASDGVDGWRHVRPHDLRRTWATETYYSLSLGGVPPAEELVMGWGGWRMTESGRQTFRTNYLGPTPDHVVERVADHLAFGD
jgi:integrase